MVSRMAHNHKVAGSTAKYLKWVREQPCVVCRSVPCDAHHIRKAGISGMGMKAPDNLVYPLCRSHHNMRHSRPWRGLWVDCGAGDDEEGLAAFYYGTYLKWVAK